MTTTRKHHTRTRDTTIGTEDLFEQLELLHHRGEALFLFLPLLLHFLDLLI